VIAKLSEYACGVLQELKKAGAGMNAPDEVIAPTDIDVFISYASADDLPDVLHAHQLAGWLESGGYAVWWDLHIQTGKTQKQLERQVKHARRVIVLWSPRAADSHDVFYECQPTANTWDTWGSFVCQSL
jgi:hypothetical protein